MLALRRSVPWNPPCSKAPRLSGKIRILSARLNDDNVMRQNEENELTACVNLPPEDLEGVYASMPISIGETGDHLKHDMALEWKDGVWKCRFCSGSRLSLIVDDDKIVLWAVSRKQRESAGFRLPIQWELG